MLNNLNKKAGLIAMLASMAASQLTAQTLTNYTAGGGDVLICFRNPNNTSGNDLVVDAGSVSNLISMSHNQTSSITAFTSNQLAQVTSNLKVYWSAFTWFNDDTLFMSNPRTSVNRQTRPWTAYGAFSQDFVATDLRAIPPGVQDNYNPPNTPFNANSTATAVLEPDQTYNASSGQVSGNYPDGESYHTVLNPTEDNLSANFGGDFQGSPESTNTVNGFPVRNDFYQLAPGGPTTYLGYFELEANGTMIYVAYPTQTPIINGFNRSGSVSTISCITGTYGAYTLRGTNSLTGSTKGTNWPAISTLPSGGNHAFTTQTYQDTDSSSNKFYIITAQ